MTLICGIDEAGRGPLCGPVFASAVIFESSLEIKNLNDSKKISKKNRIILYEEIKRKSIDYSFSFSTVKEIDNINILKSSLLAMKRAYELLSVKPDYIYVDGLYCPDIHDIPMKSIIRGDSSVPAISAASIIAKVERDKHMVILGNKYPQYNLEKHKGYPTKEHLRLLELHGINEIYRQSFSPIRKLINKKNT